MTGRPPAPATRFVRFVQPDGDCLVWTGTRDRAGYGSFSLPNGRRIKAHRWAYEQANGPIPANLQLDHLCRRTSCVNPEHLEAVTARENVLRGNNMAARFARATHCKNGHPLERVGGRRRCRICDRDKHARYRARNTGRAS